MLRARPRALAYTRSDRISLSQTYSVHPDHSDQPQKPYTFTRTIFSFHPDQKKKIASLSRLFPRESLAARPLRAQRCTPHDRVRIRPMFRRSGPQDRPAPGRAISHRSRRRPRLANPAQIPAPSHHRARPPGPGARARVTSMSGAGRDVPVAVQRATRDPPKCQAHRCRAGTAPATRKLARRARNEGPE